MTGTIATRRTGDQLAQSRLRGAILRGGTAMMAVLAASVAHAQCVDPSVGGSVQAAFVPVSSTVSGVQSLVSVLTTQNTAFLTQTSGFIGTFDTRTPGNYALSASPIVAGLTGSSAPLQGSCNIRTFQDYAGFQAGADISRLNIDGFNIHGGVTVGYTESSVRSNGSFRADFQTPFIGLYGAVTKGNFFADGQIRWDFFQGSLNDATNTLTNQRLDARSLSLTGNVGYQFPLGDGFFVEPSAGAVYAEVKVDPLKVGGAFFVAGNPSFNAPLTVKIRDFDSILGRASLRFGKNFIFDNVALQPFFTATVINEFGGPVRSTLNSNFGTFGTALDGIVGINPSAAGSFTSALGQLDTVGRLNTYRISTYGQFSVGIAGQILNTGWLGYVRGDIRTGDRVDGYGISGGIRYQFSPETVARAIISKDGPPLVPVLEGPVVWTGLSVGASVGGLWSQTDQSEFAFFSNVLERAQPHAAGVYAGGQIGADYQFDRFVVGVAGDGGFTNARGGRNCSSALGGNFFNCQTNIDDLFMATGRVGYALDRTLLYVKGGAAFADTSEKKQNNFNNQALILPFTFPNANVQAFLTGWTVGGGFEYAITKNLSAKAEYMHFELERKRYAATPANTVGFTQADHTGDVVKVGVNYRFTFDTPVLAPAPRAVIAKY